MYFENKMVSSFSEDMPHGVVEILGIRSALCEKQFFEILGIAASAAQLGNPQEPDMVSGPVGTPHYPRTPSGIH